MKHKLLSFYLLFLATALLILNYHYLKPFFSKSTQQTSTQELLPSLFDKIEIRDRTTHLSLVKKQSLWELIEPFRWKINPFSIDLFLKTLPNLAFQTDGSVKLYSQSKLVRQFDIQQKTNPISSTTYNPNNFSFLDVNFWCTKDNILSFCNLLRITFSFPQYNKKYTLNRQKESWVYSYPAIFPANSTLIQDFIQKIGLFEIKQFIPFPENFSELLNEQCNLAYQIDLESSEEQRSIKIWTQKNNTQRLAITTVDNVPVLFSSSFKISLPLSFAEKIIHQELSSVAIKVFDSNQEIFINKKNSTNSWEVFDNRDKNTSALSLDSQKFISLLLSLKPLDFLRVNSLISQDSQKILSLEVDHTQTFMLIQTQGNYYLSPFSDPTLLIQVESHKIEDVLGFFSGKQS